jgi:hypothetical protein
MTPVAILADAFKSIPDWLRQPLYLLWALFGFALGLLAAMHVSSAWGLDLEQVALGYAYASPVFGITAAANVTRKRKRREIPSIHDIEG